VTVENGSQLVEFMSVSGGLAAARPVIKSAARAPSTICLSIIGHSRSIFDAQLIVGIYAGGTVWGAYF